MTVAAALLALQAGVPHPRLAMVTATVLASQLAVGWSNDALDAGRDTATGRTDKPIPAGAVPRRAVAVAASLAALATVWLAAAGGVPAGPVALLGLLSGLLYNWPLKATPLSVVPYAVSFAALPAFVAFSRPGAPPPAGWLVAAAGLLGAGAHFANALPDLDDDVRTGVRGLPHRLGRTASLAAAAGLLLAATAVLALAPPGRPTWPGLTALGAAAVVLPVGWYAARGQPGSRVAFRAVLVVALIDAALLLGMGVHR